jgi:UDP-N-acetylmuramoyl-tripeptide--D-alanyl-D-alanine ligase
MTPIFLAIIALIWLAGTCLRVYRLARYYQIEEYMSRRFLRWLFVQREHWLPARPLAAWLVGGLLQFFLAEGGLFLPAVIAGVSGVIAVYPPDEGEVKKRFRATARAKRLLATAFILITLILFAAYLTIVSLQVARIAALPLIILSTVGFITFLLTPIWLILGNLLMTPVEAFLRRRFIARARRVLEETHPVVIGITGSYGKTTTKSFLTHILNGRYKAYPTPKSFNTLMGVCIAINNDLAQDRSIDYFIAEMGAYIPGEIARICDLTHPQISIVVEVGPQHLERFGSIENIATAKYEIIKALPVDGVGVFNWDNPYIREMMSRGYPQTRLAVSRQVNPNNAPDGVRFVASNIQETLDALRFTVTDTATKTSVEMSVPLLGAHNVTNILLAIAVAVHEGLSLKEITRRIATLQPAESRLAAQTTPQGITILNDAYSANPVGVTSALHVLGMHHTGKRLLITPGMVELGVLMESENRKLGENAAQVATDVILIGEAQTMPIKAGLLAAGFPEERLQTMEMLGEAVEWYQHNLTSGDCVLFLNDLPDTYNR